MRDFYWKVLAVTALAIAVLFLLSGRFNAISSMLGAILLFLLLAARPPARPAWAERGAWAAAFGLILLLTIGRLLEPLWELLPIFYTRKILLSWLVLSAAGWPIAGTVARDR